MAIEKSTAKKRTDRKRAQALLNEALRLPTENIRFISINLESFLLDKE